MSDLEQSRKPVLQAHYDVPKVWTWEGEAGGQFGGINRPDAGARHEQILEQGEHRFQLYSMATPNGVKVTLMFEELLELGIQQADYDAYLIDIMEGEQFGSGFVELNPNSKIPALYDKTENIRLFESGSILLYLAEQFDQFLAKDVAEKAQVMNWLFWQMGSAPFLGGGFGHFYSYAPEKIKYAIDRYAMETKRQLDVLNQQLEKNEFVAGAEYSIADIALWPWYGVLVLGELYSAAEFLNVQQYQHVQRWAKNIAKRPAARRARVVNRSWGENNEQLPERHSRTDFNKLGL
ncbi:glutathione-dependent disulfide-bond oxidoreductase [Agaribacterium haliotis]|uniref:glutathione-dependent disulfide-bond oxidoreductase n=1 Tax=Agaribacterium haliotis TaxID=2013869 RepID=UPI000BB567A3|nr:glutathione-dependent disulfide-bond oxidoreductase [Agaribacterium haliotis]